METFDRKNMSTEASARPLEEQLSELFGSYKAEWLKEKALLDEQRKLKEELDRLRTELERAQRRGEDHGPGEQQGRPGARRQSHPLDAICGALALEPPRALAPQRSCVIAPESWPGAAAQRAGGPESRRP